MSEIGDIAKLSDLELLAHLCSTSEDGVLYNEFANRFLPDLKSECSKMCKARKLDKHIGIQIAHETLEKVRKYKSFKTDGIKCDGSRKAILVYLFRISTNLLNDHHKEEKKKDEFLNHKTYFEDLFNPEEMKIDPARLKNKKNIALQIFNTLNKKEQKVVLKDIEFKKHHKYLPDDVTEQLAEELGVKKDTVRKIRERAIAKLKTVIDEVNQK